MGNNEWAGFLWVMMDGVDSYWAMMDGVDS